MRVEGKDKIEINGWLRICDLEPGELFVFENDAYEIFMKTDDERADYIDIENGELCCSDDLETSELPVKRVNAKLVVD